MCSTCVGLKWPVLIVKTHTQRDSPGFEGRKETVGELAAFCRDSGDLRGLTKVLRQWLALCEGWPSTRLAWQTYWQRMLSTAKESSFISLAYSAERGCSKGTLWFACSATSSSSHCKTHLLKMFEDKQLRQGRKIDPKWCQSRIYSTPYQVSSLLHNYCIKMEWLWFLQHWKPINFGWLFHLG